VQTLECDGSLVFIIIDIKDNGMGGVSVADWT